MHNRLQHIESKSPNHFLYLNFGEMDELLLLYISIISVSICMNFLVV